MTKIAFVCDWGESPADILQRYSRQTPNQSGTWKSIEGVKEPDEADILIVLGATSSPVNKSKSILIVREPDFIRPPDTRGFQNYLTWQQGHCGITWWLSKTYDELIALEPPNKSLDVSCISSTKHNHRNTIIEQLVINKNWLPWRKPSIVHLYGRGQSQEIFGKSYKGAIESNGNCKLDGLLPYRYSIVLENSIQKNYWTEKLADAILSWCVPIYWGCPNIYQFFDSSCIISINSDTRYRDIEKITQQPLTDEVIEKLSDARHKILNQYNIWEVIWQLIQRKNMHNL